MRGTSPHPHLDASRIVAVEHVFGEQITSPDSAEPAAWFVAACEDMSGVGGLVPHQYPRVLRVYAPDAEIDDWWSAYRDLYGIVATIGARHTTTPDRRGSPYGKATASTINSPSLHRGICRPTMQRAAHARMSANEFASKEHVAMPRFVPRCGPTDSTSCRTTARRRGRRCFTTTST